MPPLTQENRQLAIDTPLGRDVLLLTSFSGHEEISRLFSFRLAVVSAQDSISPQALMGKKLSFSVRLPDGSPRFFNGYVSRFSEGERSSGLRRYEAEIVPWLWFLTRTADCRIFQNKSVPDIIKQVFQDLGFSDFETGEIKGTHEPWEYCVQYRETDFNFVSRLMEQEGIFYYFRHEDGKHTMVLGDQKGAFKDCPESEVEYAYSRGGTARSDQLTSWSHHYEYVPGKWAQTDYNFIDHPARAEPTPSNLLMTRTQSSVPWQNIAKYEIYDYPGEYETKGAGDAQTKIRMEEEEVRHDVVHAGGTCKTFTPGGKFTISRHDNQAEEGSAFVITAIDHSGVEPTGYGGGGGDGADYSNAFTCIPDSVSFRPARITPKPVIQGSQTAVVVGPKGEEIWPDQYGRVKVQFTWDREGKRDDKTSCFIRCAQPSAGKGWGSMFIPRIGQEVVVSYLEGDPDRPLITGVVYNADQMPPYTLPDEKTKSYVKTNSSKGGDGYNELRFEDKKDQEQIFIHAQRNMDLRVRAEYKEFVGGQRNLTVGTEKAPSDHYEWVHGQKMVRTDSNFGVYAGGNLIESIGEGDSGGSHATIIKDDRRMKVGGGYDLHVAKSRSEKIDQDQSLTVGNNQQEKVGMKHAMEAGQEIHLKAGMKVVIEAGMQLTIKGPGGFVDIGPAGVTIQGTLVNINSGGAAGSGSGSSPQAPRDFSLPPPPTPNMADDSKTGQKSAPD